MLNDRQLMNYKDTFDIWRQSQPGTKNADGTTTDPVYTKVASNVLGKIFSRPEEGSSTHSVGRQTRQMGVLREEYWRGDVAQSLLDTDALVLTTIGHEYVGQCWVAQGNATKRYNAGDRTPNCSEALIHRTQKPAGVV